MTTRGTIVFDPGYDIRLAGLERLHPFDTRKFSRAWHRIVHEIPDAERRRLEPDRLGHADWMLVHTEAYFDSLRSSRTIARALEVLPAALVPARILDRRILAPMRLMTGGTLAACRSAMAGRWSINIGGGFHHAHGDHGEGFCIYADIPLAIAVLRREGLLGPDDTVWYIDLDAHRGNGVEALVEDDPRVRVMDIYNFQAYPGRRPADERFPHLAGIRAYLDGDGYLAVVRDTLGSFIAENADPKLAIYVAGTDILAGDPIGHLSVPAEQVLERDRLVLSSLAERDIPTVMTTGGGYSKHSAELIASTAIWACQRLDT